MMPTSPAGVVSGTGKVGGKYVLGPGDIIGVKVSPQDKYSVPTMSILEDGTIIYPTIGVVDAAGETVDELAQQLTQKLAVYCINPTVSINVQALRPQVVYVSGAVPTPKVLDIHAAPNVAKAITLAGGAFDTNALSRVAVMRGNQIINCNIFPLLVQGVDNGQNIDLVPGDLVIVPTNLSTVSVLGAVGKPGSYPLRMDNASSPQGPERLSDALSAASGVDKHGARDYDINVVRLVDSNSKPQVLTFNYGKYLKDGNLVNNPILQDKDVVVVNSQRSGGNTLQGALNLLSGLSIAHTILP
jgi:polysaccharide export outer membrane protein